jgi:CMP-N,N'-diacetyllegionaminic acid synthase
MRIVVLIPAKARSRRLPGKNFMLLSGRPLFMHGVDLALSVGEVDEVFVSSDSQELVERLESGRATGLLRPDHLCSDDATNFQVMSHHFAEWQERKQMPDILVLLQPTTPFRTADGLSRLISIFAADDTADSLVTVSRASRARGVIKAERWEPEQKMSAVPGRLQSAGESFEITGHAILVRPERTIGEGTLLGKTVRAELLPEDWVDIDIDTQKDWKLAQAYAALWGSEA